jgi:hypothetical protein
MSPAVDVEKKPTSPLVYTGGSDRESTAPG